MNHRISIVLLTALSCFTFTRDAEATEPYPGVTHTSFEGSWDGYPQRIHTVEVDLTHPALTIRLSGEHLAGERGTSVIARSEGAVVAVNGNYSNGPAVRGYAVSDGVPYTNMNPAYNSWALGWRNDTDWSIFNASNAAEIPADLQHAVSGCGRLVLGGVPCDGTQGCDLPGCTNDSHSYFNPRTMLGVNEAQTTLYMVVVDGRAEGATGMTLTQCAHYMHDVVGAHDAVNLDGGGSSTLYIEAEGGIINQPSNEQPERGVPNAVMVMVDPDLVPSDTTGGEDDSGGSDGSGGEPASATSSSSGDEPADNGIGPQVQGSRDNADAGCSFSGGAPRAGGWLALVVLGIGASFRRRGR